MGPLKGRLALDFTWMGGKAYDPRFLFAWPTARYAVMSGASAANTLAEVRAKQMERGGKALSDAEKKALYDEIKDTYCNVSMVVVMGVGVGVAYESLGRGHHGCNAILGMVCSCLGHVSRHKSRMGAGESTITVTTSRTTSHDDAKLVSKLMCLGEKNGKSHNDGLEML